MKSKPSLNQLGFSLTETIIGIALFALVAVGADSVLKNYSDTTKRISQKGSELDLRN